MPKRNAKPGFPSEPSACSDRALRTFLESCRSKLFMNRCPQEESVIRTDEVSSNAPAKHRRARTPRWRGLTVGVASLTAMLGTALVPGLGATPAGATGDTPGGAITLYKSTALLGNYPDRVSGTGWTADTTVTLNECAGTTYSASTCDAANQVSGVTIGTGRAAGTFKNALIGLAVGTIDSDGDTCGVAGSTPCYVVVVGNTADSTSSVALSFTLPSFTVKKTLGVLGNYVDSVKAVGFPIGDTVVAQECDASVSVPNTVSANCDAATGISGTAGSVGKVTFSSTGVQLLVAGAYTDSSGGTCPVGGTCAIGVTDSDNSAIGLSTAVGFVSPIMSLHETNALLGNYTDSVKTAGFPIGDTVVAQECDSTVVIPTTVASDCDAATQVSGTVGASGKVTLSPGVKLLVGSAYSDGASGACPNGGTCDIVVSDSANPSVGLDESVTFAVPTASVKEATDVAANYIDKVTAASFPVGDTVTAQECDSNETSANLATNCDSATQITGTVIASGGVSFSAAGVKVLVGSAYSDSAAGTCPAGGSCDIVVSDSTSGAYVAVPVGLASAS